MAGPVVSRALTSARSLRRLPMARLLALAEVLVLVREHLHKLEPQERRRLAELVRLARRRRGLSSRERRELAELVAKVEPRAFLNRAVEKVTGVPLPRRGKERH